MGKGKAFRQHRRGGFDDDADMNQDSRIGGSRPIPSAAPSFVDGAITDAVVKWFNPARGFGFVSQSNRAGDVFLPIAVLQAAGREALLPGTKLRVQIGAGTKGPQVSRIVEIESEVAEVPRPRGLAVSGRSAAIDPSTAVEIRGAVKWFNADKGFGFVEADDGEKDIFIHITVVERAGIANMIEGQRVTMRVVTSPKGREAITIALAPFA